MRLGDHLARSARRRPPILHRHGQIPGLPSPTGRVEDGAAEHLPQLGHQRHRLSVRQRRAVRHMRPRGHPRLALAD